jgi:hypothetical protein
MSGEMEGGHMEEEKWTNLTIKLRESEKQALRRIAKEEDLTLHIFLKRLIRKILRNDQYRNEITKDL